MVEIANSDQLEAWLQNKSRLSATTIGVRAALRILPLTGDYLLGDIPKRSDTFFLPFLRSMAASWFICNWPQRYISASKAIDSARAAAATIAPNIATTSGSITTPSRVIAQRLARVAVRNTAAAAAVRGPSDVASTAASARTTAVAANVSTASNMWSEITVDANLLEGGLPQNLLARHALWGTTVPDWSHEIWTELKSALISHNADWWVWNDWYDDRLLGEEHPNSRAVFDELELQRLRLPETIWKNGASYVNPAIEVVELDYRAQTPPQQPAIIEVEYKTDGKLHRRPSEKPEARTEAQEQRLQAAWAAHSQQLDTLEDLDPGKNLPALGKAIKDYRSALGPKYENMNVIALGVHGERLQTYSLRADNLLLEDAASELVAVSAAHGLFIRQFDSWLEYLSDASGEPSDEVINSAIQAAQSTRDIPEIIADDVSIPLRELAEAAEFPLTAGIEDRPPTIVRRELVRSLGNILSGLFAPLVEFARETGSNARVGWLDGIQAFTKHATIAVGYGSMYYVTALVSGYPVEFGWIAAVLKLLRSKLGL